MESPEPKSLGLSWEVGPNGSKWLADNLKEMDQSVKRMLELIEEDGSERNDEINCQKKPELIANVEGFHQLYRSLAERCELMAKELGNKSSAKLGSGDSDSGYDQLTPNVKVCPNKGSDGSPRSTGADSVFSLKEGSESTASLSSSDSDSESFVTSYLQTPLSINSQSVHQKMTELESELSATKAKLLIRVADLELEKERSVELQSKITELEAWVSDAESKMGILVGELEVARISIIGSEEEIVNLKREGNQLKNQLEVAWEERVNFETQLGSEKELVLELEEMITRYNADLSDRDLEVWELKVAQRDAEEQFLQERTQLHSDLLCLSEKQAQLETEVQELQEKTVISEAEKIEMKKCFNSQVMAIEVLNKDLDQFKMKYDTLMAEKDVTSAVVDDLVASLSARDNHILEMETYMCQFREQHDKLVDEYQKAREMIDELRSRVENLQSEVDRQRALVSDGAEEKREAIRQLCFSIEHYRSGYKELRQAFVGNRRNVVMAS